MEKTIIGRGNRQTNASGVMPGTLVAETGDTSFYPYLDERRYVDRVMP